MQRFKTALLWIALIAVFIAAFQLTSGPNRPRTDYSVFEEQVEAGGVSSVRIDGNRIEVDHWDGTVYEVLGAPDQDQ